MQTIANGMYNISDWRVFESFRIPPHPWTIFSWKLEGQYFYHSYLYFPPFEGCFSSARGATPILQGKTPPEWEVQLLLLDGLDLHPPPSPPEEICQC